MLILNDIELIKFLRPLGLLKNGEFLISNIFMTKNYLDAIEKQTIKNLNEKEMILLFELGDGFYNFFSEYRNDSFPIGIAGMSSVFQSIETNFPLVTKCEALKNFAIKQGVLVYNFEEALRLINSGEEQINYINKMLNSM